MGWGLVTQAIRGRDLRISSILTWIPILASLWELGLAGTYTHPALQSLVSSSVTQFRLGDQSIHGFLSRAFYRGFPTRLHWWAVPRAHVAEMIRLERYIAVGK